MNIHRLFIITFLAALGLWACLAPPPKTQAADDAWLLAWSSDSYVPLDYSGRALPSRGSAIKVTVLPTKNPAASQNPDALYYRWLLDGEIAHWASGQGKTFFEFRATKWGGDSYRVGSMILDSRGNTLWQGNVNIKLTNPQVLIKSSGNHYAATESVTSSTGQNLVLNAQPLFFQAQKLSDLLFDWSVDGQTLTSPDGKSPDQLTIKIPKGDLSETMFKDLSLSIRNKTDELQRTAVNIIIEIK